MAFVVVKDFRKNRPSAYDCSSEEDDLPCGPIRIRFRKPWRHDSRQVLSRIHGGKDSFKVNLDVQQFCPEELSVKTVDHFVVVEAKHEEREDEHGFVSRQFTRRYKLPDDCEPEAVVSSLSSDGVLTISAPKKKKLPNAKEIIVPIIRTQAPAVGKQQVSIKVGKKQERDVDEQEKMQFKVELSQ